MAQNDLMVPELAQVEVRGMTRSSFLLKSTLAAGAVYGAAVVSPFTSAALAQSGGDADILNYALTLEYLETDFYEQAIKAGKLSGDVKKLASQLADDESQHVDALTQAIKGAGASPAAKPTFDFGGAFASESSFLKLANTLEDTGVSAYNGAAPNIKSKDVLGAAGSIVQIEARHAALIRLARDKPPAPQAFDKASQMQAVLDAVKPLIKS